MERTISVISTFINLVKLEHHRSFLEFCNAENVIPFGLRLKKVPSLLGKSSECFNQSWRNVLDTAQSQLMTLLIIQYREQLEVSKNSAYELLRRVRPNLNREELEHITGQVTIYIYILISSISICNKNRYRNSEKTHSFKRFGQSLHQYDFPKSDGAYI